FNRLVGSNGSRNAVDLPLVLRVLRALPSGRVHKRRLGRGNAVDHVREVFTDTNLLVRCERTYGVSHWATPLLFLLLETAGFDHLPYNVYGVFSLSGFTQLRHALFESIRAPVRFLPRAWFLNLGRYGRDLFSHCLGLGCLILPPLQSIIQHFNGSMVI